jgi:hypothetical protein
VDEPVRLRVPDESDDVRDAGGELPEGPRVCVEEVPLEQQVLGRVAGERQLRKHDDLGALAAGALDRVADLRRVAVDVADRRIELGERDAQLSALRSHAPSIACRAAG